MLAHVFACFLAGPEVCVRTACLCECETSLPTRAVPLLQRPIGGVLVTRGFTRAKEGTVAERSHPRIKWEQELEEDTLGA